MRKILFRGKSKETGEWLQGDLLQYAEMVQIWVPTENGKWNYIVDPDTIGQYTGLNDKNGVRIFEGDIVKQGNRVYVVKWKSENASFELYLPCGAEQSGFNAHTTPHLEVIGNIYDNPELLKLGSSEIERK